MKKGKKFIALFLISSLLTLSVNLYAKERRGAKLIITKKDGQQIEGELIVVKPNSLLLLDTEGKDVSVGIADIKVIRIVKKSKWLLGAGLGLLIGGIAGGLIGEELLPSGGGMAVAGGGPAGLVIGAPVGVLIGGGMGAVLGTDKTIQIEGMTDLEIQEALDKLRKKARIRDYK